MLLFFWMLLILLLQLLLVLLGIFLIVLRFYSLRVFHAAVSNFYCIFLIMFYNFLFGEYLPNFAFIILLYGTMLNQIIFRFLLCIFLYSLNTRWFLGLICKLFISLNIFNLLEFVEIVIFRYWYLIVYGNMWMEYLFICN